MKNIRFVLWSLLAALTFSANAQSEIAPPAPGPSVDDIVRTSIYGAALNFSYMDSATLIGRFPGPAYVRYECEPGHHLLWARSENRDYVEAELAPDKIYFILALVETGAIKAQVDLIPINPSRDTKDMARMMKLIERIRPMKFTDTELKADALDLAPAIDRGLETYASEQQSGVKHDVLPADWYYVPQSF